MVITPTAESTAGNVFNAGAAVYQFAENPTMVNATRVAVQGIAAAVSFIPVAGWGISLGIGIADAVWGDKFYNWIDKH
ncbi:MAG: hypothetical protein K2Y12_04535 [Chitinophagaceae bacterium]|nr:hypothetical protein [Chitinophagaceae bacterium]